MALSLAHPASSEHLAVVEQMPRRRKYSAAVLATFVLHLIIPAFFAVDIGINWGRAGTTEDIRVVFVVACAWLASGTALLLRSRWRRSIASKAGKVLISFWLFVLLIAFFETAYWALTPPVRPFLFKPNTVSTVVADPSTMPGIRGSARLTTNEIGLRGTPVPPPHDALRIVTIGGSTTACSLLDDSTQWPSVLMDRLNHSSESRPVWVGNAGVDGQGTVHHLALLQTLPIFRHADLLLFMIGVNDMQAALANRGQSSQAMLEHDAALRGEEIEGGGHPRTPLIRRSHLYEMLRESIISIKDSDSNSEDNVVEWLRNNRSKRAQVRRVALPDLSLALTEYRNRIVSLAQACDKLSAHCAFVTQPSLYRDDLTSSERALLWGGWVGPAEKPDGYISAGDAARAIAAYNKALLDVCTNNSLTCFDLATAIPHTTASFYDDVHLNEEGSREAAGFLAARMTQSAVLAGPHTPSKPMLPQ